MNKISILDTFAADAINAPAMITGGGKCKAKSKSKKKSKKGSKGTKGTKGSKKSKYTCPPVVVPPVCPPPVIPCKW